ncbi:beta-propeller fold lactonase family protein [Streptomyces sp. NPDC058272]|uniref:YVTN family beta-propeller repeat protein n=1 Tax=Streptomyces sp. NPDC058272 TaxID=3346415 RepID=UPI0036E3D89E
MSGIAVAGTRGQCETRRSRGGGASWWTLLRAWVTGLTVLAGMVVPLAAATPAAAQDNTFAYVTNDSSGTVSVIDTATNTVTATIPVGTAPQGVALTPDGTRVYVTNSGSDTVSVIDTSTNTVTATVPVGVGPRGVAVGGSVYVTNAGSDTVSVIDTSSNTVTATIPVGDFPQGVGVSPDTVYVTNSNSDTVSVIDTSTNTVTATIPVGGFPLGVAVALVGGANVYVTNSNSDTVSVIDSATNTVTATVPVGDLPQGVAVTPDTSRVYVTNAASDTVSVIDTSTNTVTATIPVGDLPVGVAVGSVPLTSQTPTTLTLKVEERRGHVVLKATLTAGGQPLEGKAIEFTTDSTSLCTDTTDSRGQATCEVPRGQDNKACYTATFAGDDTHGPSTATVHTEADHGGPHPSTKAIDHSSIHVLTQATAASPGLPTARHGR